MKINGVLVSVQTPTASKAYGQLSKVPLVPSARAGLLRVVIPDDVPSTATVTKAEIVLHARSTWSTSTTFTAQRLAAGFQVSKATWNNKPAVTGTAVTKAVASAVDGTEFRLDVTSDVQAIVSGSISNRGWFLTSSAGTTSAPRLVYGSPASKWQPYLELAYTEPVDPPSELSPDGAATSLAKPTLTSTAPDDLVSLQVQIDPDAMLDELPPDWDSGEVPTTGGVLDLTTTTYPGLALNATTSWRARAKTSVGWSDWSSWASFTRTAKPTVTITAPAATTGDQTPPIVWTATGQVSWRAQLLDAVTGDVLADSGRTTSADHEWTPPKGLRKVGDVGRAHVMVWDGVDRVASPGDPTYSEATFDFTLVAVDSAPGASTISAVQTDASPVVRLSWSGSVPDKWRITRDGDWIATVEGATTEYIDYGADPNAQHVYQALVAYDTGAVSPNGPTATITPRTGAVWLMDEDSGKKIVVIDAQIDSSMVEQAVLHAVLGTAPVRRRAGSPPLSGAVTGLLLDGPDDDFPADTLAKRAMQFKGNGQGHVYRLVWGSWNLPVTIGDMSVNQALLDDTGRPSYSIAFSWWATGDDLPWEG